MSCMGAFWGLKVTQDSTAVSESSMWKPKILRQRLVCPRRSCQYSERFLIEVNCNVDTAIYKWKPTRRTEWKIIEQVGLGASNKEIAASLHFSEGTIRNYLSVILDKLSLRDRTQLAIWYVSRGKNE